MNPVRIACNSLGINGIVLIFIFFVAISCSTKTNEQSQTDNTVSADTASLAVDTVQLVDAVRHDEQKENFTAPVEQSPDDNSSISKDDLIGTWAMGDQFVFRNDNTFSYSDPLCTEDATGKWKLDGNDLTLTFINIPCKESQYDTHYEVTQADKDELTFKDDKGESFTRHRN